MAKRYDAGIKQLVEQHPADWIAFMGLPPGRAEVVDADLSTISPAADKVIRVEAAEPYIAHLEFQASNDIEFDRRMLMYNALLRWRHKLPVKSVAVLLRREADGSGTTGRFVDSSDSGAHLEFRYRLVRVWELSPDVLLTSGLGMLPLAPIGRASREELPTILDQVDRRLEGITASEAADARISAYVLLGLRYPVEVGRQLLTGVRQMKESVTYQAILEEGAAMAQAIDKNQVRLEELKAMILRLGERRHFGVPDVFTLRMLESITDVQKAEAILERVVEAPGWTELFTNLV